MNVVSLLQGAAPQGSLLGMIVPFALIFVIFYFFIIRPQNKKQKETQKMISALKKGDKVVSIGGIHGVISSTKEQSVIVKVDDNFKIEFSRSAISTIITDTVDKATTKGQSSTERYGRAGRGKKSVEISKATDSEENTSEENTSEESTK